MPFQGGLRRQVQVRTCQNPFHVHLEGASGAPYPCAERADVCRPLEVSIAGVVFCCTIYGTTSHLIALTG